MFEHARQRERQYEEPGTMDNSNVSECNISIRSSCAYLLLSTVDEGVGRWLQVEQKQSHST